MITSEFTPLLPPTTSLVKFNDEYLAANKDCAQRIMSCLQIRKLLSADKAEACEKDVAALLKLPTITMTEAKEALDLLESWKSKETKSFREGAEKKWPKATIFSTAPTTVAK